MKQNFFLITWLLLWPMAIAQAQWKPINPGAGGQVQDVVGDPNRPGRLLLASDMEGIYESTDHGESWHSKGNLKHNRVYAVHMPQNDPNKVYVGTLYGLEVSTDGGKKFQFVDKTKRISIGAVAVSPHNNNVVIAGVGWRDDYQWPGRFGLSTNGQAFIYRTTDGGRNWARVNLGNTENTDRNIFQIQFHPTNANIVYLGSTKGVFVSTNTGRTWSRLASPGGTVKNRGVAISPNGKVLYAAFSNNGNLGHIYATSTQRIQWQRVAQGTGVALGNFDFWYPEVDQRSGGDTHKVIISLQGRRDGLFEGEFRWANNRLQGYQWRRIWFGMDGYDNGWDNAPPNPRFVHYTPKKWPRAVCNRILANGST